MLEEIFDSMNKREIKKFLSVLNPKEFVFIKFVSDKKVDDLKSFISGYNKQALLLLATAYNIEVVKYNRPKLIKQIIEKYEKQAFVILFNLLNKYYLKEIDRIIKESSSNSNNLTGNILCEFDYSIENKKVEVLEILSDLGLCSVFQNMEEFKQEFCIPKEVIKVYKNMNVNLEEGKKIVEYIGKIVFLMGVVKLDRIYTMLKLYVKKDLSYEKFLIYIFGYIRLEIDSYIYDDYLVYFSVKKEDVEKYIKIQEKYQICKENIMEKEILDIYYKDRLVLSPFMLNFLKNLDLDSNLEVCNEIADYLRLNLDSDDESVDKVYNIICSYTMLEKNNSFFINIIKLGVCDTRMYKYAGIKINEIVEKESFLSSLELFREDKQISRNQICPCGSGKKYKRCCGK